MASSGPNPFNTTDAPADAKARAIPRPIPLVLPVTMATLPAREWGATRVGRASSMFMMSLLFAIRRMIVRQFIDAGEVHGVEMPSHCRFDRGLLSRSLSPDAIERIAP